MEALCDGLNDCSVGYMYELRFHPEEKVHQPWLDRLWGKAENALVAASTMLPPIGDTANIGTCALASSLGYLDFRFEGKWESAVPALVEWNKAFDEAHPGLAALKAH
jgi:glutathione S-transferase